MRIADIVTLADVVIDVRATTKAGVLEALARRCAAACGVAAPTILAGLQRREELGSTGMGGGIAIPHARLDAVMRPRGCLTRLAPPVDFEAIDDEPVDLVFALVLPVAGSDQLSALAEVARTLRSQQVLERLRQARSERELYAALF